MAQRRLPHGVKVGDTIRITKLDDPYDKSYVGREGVVEFIDSMDQIHGLVGWSCRYSRRGRLHRHQTGQFLGSVCLTCFILWEQNRERSDALPVIRC